MKLLLFIFIVFVIIHIFFYITPNGWGVCEIAEGDLGKGLQPEPDIRLVYEVMDIFIHFLVVLNYLSSEIRQEC